MSPRLHDSVWAEARRLLADTDLPVSEIARRLGVSPATIHRARHGQVPAGDLAPIQRPPTAPARARITRDQATQIRRLLLDTSWSQARIAAEVGATRSAVNSIALGRSWTELGGRVDRPPRNSDAGDQDRAVEIRRRLEAGDSYRQIAAACGASRSLVGAIATGKLWRRLGPPPQRTKEQP